MHLWSVSWLECEHFLATAKYYYRYRAVWFIDRNVYGYSGIILAGQPTIDPPWYYLALASGAGLTCANCTTLLALAIHTNTRLPTHWFQARSANWAVGAGLLMLGLAVALQLIVPDWQWWAEASAFSAICANRWTYAPR